MLSRLKGAVHKMLTGAAEKVAPATDEKIVLPTPELSIEDLIRYPPETKGIPVISLDKILSSQYEILRLMHRDSGLPDPDEGGDKKKAKSKGKGDKEYELNFDTLFRQVVVNYIRYVHLLPASENHHHSDVGGLARHSLEVALNSLRKSQQQVLPAIGHLDEEQARKPRWQYAAWVCGLLHDAGKILFDMRVYDVDTGKDWNPYLSDLLTWAGENNVSRYRVTWRPEHRHKKHENLTVQVLEWVLTPEAKAYLMDNTDELPIAINHALAHYGSQDGYLQSCLRMADSASTEKDIRTQWHEMIGKRRYPLESAIVAAMRRLRDNWEVNKPKGHVWIIGEEVFLSWPKSIQLIVQRLQDDKVDVPVNPTRILEILEERNLVHRLDESVTYSMFTPDMENVAGMERVIRLAWPGLLYETMPVPRSVPGVLRLNNEGKSLDYKEDGTIIEIEPDSESDDKAESAPSTESTDPVSESSRKANEKAKQPKDKKPQPVKKTNSKPKKASHKNGDTGGAKPVKAKAQAKKPATGGDVDMPNIPTAGEKPQPKQTNKGLTFANQSPSSEKGSGTTPATKEVEKPKPQQEAEVAAIDPTTSLRGSVEPELEVPAYLTQDDGYPAYPMEDDGVPEMPAYLSEPDWFEAQSREEVVEPVNQSAVIASKPKPELKPETTSKPTTLPVSEKGKSQREVVSTESVVQVASGKGDQEAPKTDGKPPKSNVPVGNMLRRKASFDKGNAQAQVPKGWLGQKKHGRNQGDVFLIDLATAMANGSLGVDSGNGVFLVDGQLHLDVKAISQVLNVEAGPISTSLKNARQLDYDTFKPNLLVQRKKFGVDTFMVISLTKAVSKQMREDLGLTVESVDYMPAERPVEKPTPVVAKKDSAVSRESNVASQTPAPAKAVSKPANDKAVSKLANDKDDEITQFLSFLNEKSTSSEVDYMQQASDGQHWAIYVQGAVKAFTEEVRSGAGRNSLSKELTMQAVGVVDLETKSGTKKHLLIRKELIG